MLVKYMHNEEFIDYLKSSGKKIICFGTGTITDKIISHIHPYIHCFLDNNSAIEGNYKYGTKEYPIFHPDEVTDIIGKDSGYVVLIASKHRRDMVAQLRTLISGDVECIMVYEYFDINIHNSMSDEVWYNKRLLEPTIKDVKKKMALHGYQEKHIREKLQEIEEKMGFFAKDRKLIIPKLVFLATTKCTLRCKGCVGLIPCFESPQDFSFKDIKRDIDIVLNEVDEITVAEIGGGEPFLYSDFDELLKYMISQEKIKGIIIPSNATLIPSPDRIQLLKNPKVSLHVSDYGNLVQLAKFISILEENDIAFHFVAGQMWINPGNGTSPRNKSYEQLCVEYQSCNSGLQCKTVFGGRLYHCARAARNYQLLNDSELLEKDSISILGKENLREDIIGFYLSEMSYACDYCDYQNALAGEIEAGIQPNEQRKKSKYTIVKR